jgi:hypothetical protein
VTWDDLARDNYSAARDLLIASYPRACIGRCYYAVYCAVAARLSEKGFTTFRRGNEIWLNPPHETIPSFVRNNLGLGKSYGEVASESVELLRLVRVDADYKPWTLVDSGLAADALREASFALSFFGVVI